MSTKLHITQQYVYKTANNIHVYKTCLKKAKKCTYAAPHQLCDILHKRFQKGTSTNQKENTMFDFQKQYKDAMQQAEKTAHQVNEFWFNAIKEFFNTVKTK